MVPTAWVLLTVSVVRTQSSVPRTIQIFHLRKGLQSVAVLLLVFLLDLKRFYKEKLSFIDYLVTLGYWQRKSTLSVFFLFTVSE